MTISKKASSITKKASAVTLLIITIVAGIVFAAPSLSLAQQQTATGTSTVTTPAPLTPEEQQQQERLESITAATTRKTCCKDKNR